MPHSSYEPDDTLVPETPDGYRDPIPFRYPNTVLLGIVAVIVPLAIIGFGHLLWYAQGAAGFAHVFTVTETADSVSFSLTSGGVVLVFLASIVLITVLHELVHGLVYEYLGYDVSYGVAPHLGAFYAAAFHQFQPRNNNIVVGLAPLVVLDLLLLPVLFAPWPLLAFAAFVGLLFNTAGAAGDLYLVARLLRTAPGTCCYDSDIRHSYLFEPVESSG